MEIQEMIQGVYVVAGMVAGTHIIEDIKVPVPHQVAVRIPADLAHKSKDLWRGIQAGKLFMLTGGYTIKTTDDLSAPIAVDTLKEFAALKEEFGKVQKVRDELEIESGLVKKGNENLRRDLTQARVENDALRQENESLKEVLRSLQAQQDGKLEDILSALTQLSSRPVQMVSSTGIAMPPEASLGVVGGESPMFIPADGFKPVGAETSIQVVESTSEGSSIDGAAKKLKGLRRKSTD
jgi:hypothetical protein